MRIVMHASLSSVPMWSSSPLIVGVGLVVGPTGAIVVMLTHFLSMVVMCEGVICDKYKLIPVSLHTYTVVHTDMATCMYVCTHKNSEFLLICQKIPVLI